MYPESIQFFGFILYQGCYMILDNIPENPLQLTCIYKNWFFDRSP